MRGGDTWQWALVAALVALWAAGVGRARATEPEEPGGSKVEIIFLGDPASPGSQTSPALRGSPPAPTAAAPRTAASSPTAPAGRAKPRGPASRASRRAAARAGSAPPAAVAPPARGGGGDAPPSAAGAGRSADDWGPGRRRPLLGDGSTAGELVAAAQRIVGLRASPERPFAAHLLAAVGLPLELAAPPADAPAEALAALSTAGCVDAAPRPDALAQGDLVFFGRPEGGTLRLAVVEAIDRQGRVHLIGPLPGASGDVVQRTLFDPRAHRLHAVARP